MTDQTPARGNALWVAIAATVIGGLIVYFLTRKGGPLNPEPTPTAKLVILDHDVVGQARVGTGITMRFKVYNSGDANAVGCAIYWESSEEFSRLYQTEGLRPNASYQFTLSERFDLTAKTTTHVTAKSLPYETPGKKHSRVTCGCYNALDYDVESPAKIISVTVH